MPMETESDVMPGSMFAGSPLATRSSVSGSGVGEAGATAGVEETAAGVTTASVVGTATVVCGAVSGLLVGSNT